MTEYVPSEFYLGQNYPNPFTEKTTIKYCVPHKTKVKLTVFNSNGQMLKKLVDEVKDPGTYEIEFCIQSHPNISLENGIYSYRLVAENYLSEKEMTLIK